MANGGAKDEFVMIPRARLHKVETAMIVSKEHIGDAKLAEQQTIDAVARQIAEILTADGNAKTTTEPGGFIRITCTTFIIRKAQ